ncbi:hypothetical protein, partial [Bittarella massiliensis (ex Durand et al. 2017)]
SFASPVVTLLNCKGFKESSSDEPKAVELQRIEGSRYLVTALGERDDPAPAEEDRWAGDYQVIDELPYWGNGAGFTTGKRRRLYLFDAQTGTCEPIT